MENVYFSIVITTYNARKFVSDTLKSIREQTYSHYEVIIVDDGSTDDTVAIVQAFIESNGLPNFKLVSCEHIGRARVLNFGVNVAQYDWIAIVDADDVWYARKLEIQAKYIEREDIDLLSTRTYFMRNVVPGAALNRYVSSDSVSLCKISLHRLLLTNPIAHSSVVIRKDICKYNEKLTSHVDYELWLRIASQGCKLFLLPLHLTFARLHAARSFEGKKQLKYSMRTFLLSYKYAKITKKHGVIPLLFFKLCGYLCFNKKVRVNLYDFCQKMNMRLSSQ